ncbi:MAG: Beta-galactosidase trimerization domain protein [Chthonomonadales bacterium]|nr:Beta-galactosidase trimerization domain protein [Chthonomonadales bacterium]
MNRTNRRAWLAILGTLSAAIPGHTQSLPGAAEPMRIVLEAEDMRGVVQDKYGPGRGWQVGRWGHDLYQNMVFGGVWASRLRTAMTDDGANASEVYSDIVVPTGGKVKIWAKYEAPPYFNYAFGIRIQPLDGSSRPAAPVYEKVYGLLDAPKHFSFMDTLVRGSLYWSWGIDHDAAEGYEASLESGRYRVTLFKTANPAPSGARSVDTILITSDLSELSSPRLPRYPMLDELRRANHVYFRFRNLSDRAGRVTWNHWGHRNNDFYEAAYRDLVRYYDAAGKPLTTADKSGTWPDPISPHGASVWHDLGPTMNVESTSPFRVRMQSANAQKPDVGVPSLPFAVDIALEPNAHRIVKSFTLEPGEPDLAFLVQPDLDHKEGLTYTRTLPDLYRDITRQLDAEPRLGPIPKRMKFFAGTQGPRSLKEDLEITQGFRHALGLNTLEANNFDRASLDAISHWWQERGGIIRRSLAYQHSDDIPATIATIHKAGVEDYFYLLSFGDEIGLPPVDVRDAAAVTAFREFVRAEGETPQTLGVAGWEQVRPLSALSAEVAVQTGVLPTGTPKTDAETGRLKRLFWYSSLFRIRRGVETFAAKTQEFQTLLGPDVRTSANLGGQHPFYWMSQASFIDSFRGGAMSLAWSEDYTYTQPEGSRLIADFDAAYLRKGASYHHTPMMFYCMPHYPGNSPQLLLQNVVMQWANNVKDIDWFQAGPDAWSTENYIAYRGGMPMWKMLRTVSGMAGLIEDDLVPANVEPTPIAMLLSASSDLWEVEGGSQNDLHPAAGSQPASKASNISQEERKAIWYALRQAGYRVDFVTENDVKAGLLKNYRALYVCGANLERQAAEGIREWVRTGGVLFATAGAARKNEFDELLTTLDEALGRGTQIQYQRYRGPLRARLELLFEKPLDRLTVSADPAMPASPSPSDFDALCSQERFHANPVARVLARYRSDKSPAFVEMGFGKGMGYYIGTLPGQAYLKPALPIRPTGKGGEEGGLALLPEPVAFDGAALEAILRPLRAAQILPDVVAAHRSVVSGRLSSAKSIVVPLVNLAEQHDGTLKDLKIEVRDIESRPTRVWSCFYPKGVPFVYVDHVLTITLPALRSADVIILSR